MSLLDIIYLLLLVLSIPLGCLVKSCRSRSVKEWICFTSGISITLGLNGIYGSTHSFLTILGNYFIVKLCNSRYCPLVSFVFVFVYLLFYRLCTLIGLPQPPKHSNAVQLLVTLRMISLSFEISDSVESNDKSADKISDSVESNDKSADNISDSVESNDKSADNISDSVQSNDKSADNTTGNDISRLNDINDEGESVVKNKNEGVPVLKNKENRSISLFNFLAYGYCYIGLLTGPFYTYKTFNDMLCKTDNTPSLWKAIQNLKAFPFLAVVYLLLKANFPLEDLKKEEFFHFHLLYSFYVVIFTSMWFRWRFYLGWLLAESSCISCGLGAYPIECESKPGVGPTKPLLADNRPGVGRSKPLQTEHIPDLKTTKPLQTDNRPDLEATKPLQTGHIPDLEPTKPVLEPNEQSLTTNGPYSDPSKPHNFETVHNIKVYEVELGTSMKSVMRDWNMTVQWWMSTYVYKRLPFKSYYLKLAITLAVSSFWHGIHSGYYLSFLSAIFMVFAQSNLDKSINLYLNANTRYVYDWISWIFLFRYIDYLAIPFMLLEFQLVWRVWSKLYFYGHVIVVCFIIVPFFIKRKKEKL